MRSTIAALFALALVAPAAAQKRQPPPRQPARPAPPRPDLKEWSLPNGLSVVYLGVHKAPVVTVQVWYHAGSKDEPRNRRGSAHMFEHMMFKGTERVPPEEFARLIDRVGGSVNAGTTEDVTFYHATLPSKYLDFAVMLEAERMRHLLFRKQMIDTEREVVKEEIRVRIENNPISAAFVRFRELAFTKHPYAWTAAGTIADLDQTTPEDLKRFYDAYYQPNNATLVVVGDVTEEEVRAAAEKHFGPVPKGGEPPRPSRDAAEPKQTELRKETAKGAQIGLIIGGYKIPEAKSPDIYALQVLKTILSDGESSRLHQRVVRKDKVGVFAGAEAMILEEPGMLLVFGVHLAPDQAPKLEAALMAEVDRLAKQPVTARELEKAKNQLASQFVFGLEGVDGLARQIGTSKLLLGDAKAWMDGYDKFLAVTAQDVMRVAKTYLVKENLTLVFVPPTGGQQ